MTPSGSWAMQQLAGFLTAIGGYPDEDAMTEAAVHRVAESLDAEVCALIAGDQLVAAIGYPPGDAPVSALLAIAADGAGSVDVPGAGLIAASSVTLHVETEASLVVARASGPLDTDELHVLRAMAQVFEMALQLRRTADSERLLRERIQQEAEILEAANAHLADAAQLKSDLLSMTSHELRTPLVSINGFATLLIDQPDLPEEERTASLDAIRRHGRRLQRLVDDLLLVGRIDGQRLDVDAQAVEVLPAIEVALTGPEHEDVTIAGEPGATAWADPDHLVQMVLNLVVNAERYGEPPVSIVVTREADEVVLTVSDHGAGVPESFVPKLFEPFARGASRGAGTGLGLAIINGLARANGGWVRYEPRPETRFVVGLPAAPAPADDDDA